MVYIHNWEEFLQPYELTLHEMKLKLEGIRKQYKQKNLHSPIESVRIRVKTISSILEKADRMGISVDQLGDKLYDIAGIRINCQFVEDIFSVVEMLKNRSDIEIVAERDFISNPKGSGYKSYHLHGFYNLETIDGTKRVLFEAQIRTMVMNFWATIEHTLNYKYKGEIPKDIEVKLIRASEAASALDREMSEIKHEIASAQQHFKTKQRNGYFLFNQSELYEQDNDD